MDFNVRKGKRNLPFTMSGPPSFRLSNFPSFYPDPEKKIRVQEEDQGTNGCPFSSIF